MVYALAVKKRVDKTYLAARQQFVVTWSHCRDNCPALFIHFSWRGYKQPESVDTLRLYCSMGQDTVGTYILKEYGSETLSIQRNPDLHVK